MIQPNSKQRPERATAPSLMIEGNKKKQERRDSTRLQQSFLLTRLQLPSKGVANRNVDE
jgi:hypothetical protein